MEYPSVEELRRWSAEVQGWDLVVLKRELPGYLQTSVVYKKPDGSLIRKDCWAPDLDTSPAWQILAVIKAMKLRGHRYFSNHCGDRFLVYFDNSDGELIQGPSGKAIDDSFQIALLRAAHAACQEVEE